VTSCEDLFVCIPSFECTGLSICKW